MEKFIYEGGKLNLLSQILFAVFLISITGIVILVSIETQSILAILIFGVINILIHWLSRKSISRYRIYSDRIEIINYFSKKIIETIPLESIEQVRFEDEFGETPMESYFSQDIIFLYPKANFKSKFLKKDKFKLPVLDYFNRVEKLTLILKVFQDTQIDLFVITNRKQLLQDLNIRNWNNP